MNDTIVFVFGSNARGRHGAGAALAAYKDWGAAWGVGEGLEGCSYAIPTKDEAMKAMPLATIAAAVARFCACARSNPYRWFLVSGVGTGYAGLTIDQMAPLFRDMPPNVQLPLSWQKWLEAH